MRFPLLVSTITLCCARVLAAEATTKSAPPVEARPPIFAPQPAVKKVPAGRPRLPPPAARSGRAISPEMSKKLSEMVERVAPPSATGTASPVASAPPADSSPDTLMMDPFVVNEDKEPKLKERQLLTPKRRATGAAGRPGERCPAARLPQWLPGARRSRACDSRRGNRAKRHLRGADACGKQQRLSRGEIFDARSRKQNGAGLRAPLRPVSEFTLRLLRAHWRKRGSGRAQERTAKLRSRRRAPVSNTNSISGRRKSRSFEDISVKLRDTVRVAVVVKITEAGLQARFQTLDPTHPPQPVYLKGGAAARILLMKIARDFETTRTNFIRVEPYVEPDLF